MKNEKGKRKRIKISPLKKKKKKMNAEARFSPSRVKGPVFDNIPFSVEC